MSDPRYADRYAYDYIPSIQPLPTDNAQQFTVPFNDPRSFGRPTGDPYHNSGVDPVMFGLGFFTMTAIINSFRR
jgi:hypothetical protein